MSIPDPNLVHRTEEYVASAVRSLSFHSEISYAVSMTVVPGEAQGTFVPVMIVVLTSPSAMIGDRLFANLVSFDIHMTEEYLTEQVKMLVQAMDDQRDEMLRTDGLVTTV